MEWLAVVVLFLTLCVLLNLLLPHPPPSRWRRGVERRTARLTARLHRHREPEPDPFDTLRLQTPSFGPDDPSCCPSRIEHQTIGFDTAQGRVRVLERTFTPVG